MKHARFLPSVVIAGLLMAVVPCLVANETIYMGQITNGTTSNPITFALNQDQSAGNVLGILPGLDEAFDFSFATDSSGNWTATGVTWPLGPAVANGVSSRLKSQVVVQRVLSGVVSGNTITGSLTGTTGTSITFTATQQSSTGPNAAIAGYYTAPLSQSLVGTAYFVVGTQNVAYVLINTPEYTGGAAGTVDNNGNLLADLGTGITVSGSINASTTVISGTFTDAGVVTETFSGLLSTTMPLDQLVALSARGDVMGGTSGGDLVAGFVIGGSQPRTVVLRAVGPSLANFGFQDFLAAPTIKLYSGSTVILTASDWSSSLAPVFASLGAFPLITGSKDTAVETTLNPGAYTMQVPNDTNSGIALAEVYDANPTLQSLDERIVDISARGIVGQGDKALIGGFVVTGNYPKKLLIRGVGPGLLLYGVQGSLADPLLKVYDSNGNLLAENSSWQNPTPLNSSQPAASASEISSAEAATGAFVLPSGGRDTAVIVTLNPGAYTAMVTSADGTSTGIALVEIYEVPQ